MAIKEELVKKMNGALALEHAARIQYLAHAELVKGQGAEKIIERLKEIASDEESHETKFREMIGNYLGGEPCMDLAETHRAGNINEILQVNLKDEKDAIGIYKEIYTFIIDNKENLPYTFERLEHEMRHIILDEEEHVAELSMLLGD
jgi:bacterioferritin